MHGKLIAVIQVPTQRLWSAKHAARSLRGRKRIQTQ